MQYRPAPNWVKPVNRKERATVRVSLFLHDRFSLANFSTIVEAIRVSNYLLNGQAFELDYLSNEGGTVTSKHGSVITRAYSTIAPSDVDLVIFCDLDDIEIDGMGDSSHLKSWVDLLDNAGVSICAMGTMTYLLAKLGLLKKRHIAVAWMLFPVFKKDFPDCYVHDSLMETDGNMITCAGGSAALDFMLLFITETRGNDLGAAVSDYLLCASNRKPSDRQRPLSVPFNVEDSRLAQALQILDRSPFVDGGDVAKEIGVSRRQLERMCKRYLNTTPGKIRVIKRLERARMLLQRTDLSIANISRDCGFVSNSHFSKLYKHQFGKPPSRDRLSTTDNFGPEASITAMRIMTF